LLRVFHAGTVLGRRLLFRLAGMASGGTSNPDASGSRCGRQNSEIAMLLAFAQPRANAP
jgi:hypothetical protein